MEILFHPDGKTNLVFFFTSSRQKFHFVINVDDVVILFCIIVVSFLGVKKGCFYGSLLRKFVAIR